MDAKELGRRGEDAAAAYLERRGMTVVDRNWRCRVGEIDIVALDGDVLVMCEVKTRRNVQTGTPEEAVSPAKQRKLVKLAEAYYQTMGGPPEHVRFDVVSITLLAEDRALLRHHISAFAVA